MKFSTPKQERRWRALTEEQKVRVQKAKFPLMSLMMLGNKNGITATLGRCGKLHPMFGKHYTIESRRKMSKKGSLNPMFGKNHTKKALEKISKVSRQRFSDPKNYEEHVKMLQSISNPSKFELSVGEQLQRLGHRIQRSMRLENRIFDIHILNTNVLVEADGVYWHSLPGAKENDKYKDRLAAENGYRVVRITDAEFPSMLDEDIVDRLGLHSS